VEGAGTNGERQKAEGRGQKAEGRREKQQSYSLTGGQAIRLQYAAFGGKMKPLP